MFCCYPERNVTFLEDLKGIVADSTTERNSSNLIYQGKKLHWYRFTCWEVSWRFALFFSEICPNWNVYLGTSTYSRIN